MIGRGRGFLLRPLLMIIEPRIPVWVFRSFFSFFEENFFFLSCEFYYECLCRDVHTLFVNAMSLVSFASKAQQVFLIPSANTHHATLATSTHH